MTSLFELARASHLIQQQIRDIGDNLDPDDPESINRLETLLLEGENSNLQIGEKADATCWVISNFLAQAKYLREQAERLNKLAEKDENRALALQNRLIDIMRRLYPDKSRIPLYEHDIISRQSQGVIIEDQTQLPERFLKRKETVTPDKEAIKNAIKSGERVAGAKLERRINWRIS